MALGTTVSVDEIYGNCHNVQTLYDLIGGGQNTTFERITELATARTSAADIRGMTYNKTANQDVQVTFGGQVWDVVYLSTTRDKRPILTLWLSSSLTKSPWNLYTSTTGNKNYPAKMYSTSYIRVVTLNNGGNYATSETNLVNCQPSTTVVLSRFTVDDIEESLTKLLVKPQAVSWQEQQYTHDFLSPIEGDMPNEGYSSTGNYSWQNLNQAVVANPRYGVWAGDYCWLPSVAETVPETGIWGVNTNQTTNPQGIKTWLRSGDDNGMSGAGMGFCMLVETDGSVNCDTNDYCTSILGVRPALHLDLLALNAARSWGHNYSDWELIAEPTCADGEYTRVCQNCGHLDHKVIPAVTAHQYGEWLIVGSTGDNQLLLRRIFPVCGAVQEGTVPPYRHQISMTSDGFGALALTITIYTDQTTAFTGQDWLTYLNGLTNFDYLICHGTYHYFHPEPDGGGYWGTATVVKVDKYSENMFTYYYVRVDGVMEVKHVTITDLTINDQVQYYG